jgi:hypothetical protein
MIDFLKLNVSYLLKMALLNNPLIEWKQEGTPDKVAGTEIVEDAE